MSSRAKPRDLREAIRPRRAPSPKTHAKRFPCDLFPLAAHPYLVPFERRLRSRLRERRRTLSKKGPTRSDFFPRMALFLRQVACGFMSLKKLLSIYLRSLASFGIFRA